MTVGNFRTIAFAWGYTVKHNPEQKCYDVYHSDDESIHVAMINEKRVHDENASEERLHQIFERLV